MTTRGCQICPEEDVITPLRNVAIGIGMAVFALLWLLYSWAPFLPIFNFLEQHTQQVAEDGQEKFEMFAACCEGAQKVSEVCTYLQSVKAPQYFKIFVTYFQVISSFLTFQVEWPSTLRTAMVCDL